MPTLASIHLHPVKGCASLTLDEATLGPLGLEHAGVGDREWMVVDAASGRFETQRSLPRLARIEPSAESGALVLRAPGTSALRIDAKPAPGRECRAVVVWRHTVAAIDEGDDAARWLSSLLGRSLRLVRWNPAAHREADPHWTRSTPAGVRFPDGFPMLVASEASLAQVNRWLATAGRQPLPMDRFRPNLVLSGLEPFEEDRLGTLACGRARIRLVKPCTRCSVPSIDQATGERGPDPLDVLEDHRMDARLGGVTFGMNAIVEAGAGTRLRVGETIQALQG